MGIGCRFPNTYGPEEFWQFLSQGEDAIAEVPASRFDIDTYHDPRPRTPNRVVSRLGGFLDQIDEFDAGYFGVAPREAERMDPQQRLLLETTGDAIADAGLTPEHLSQLRTGVYVGGMSSAYSEKLTAAGIMDLYASGGGARSFMSGRISFAFDMRGPSVSVDSACSSGLSALHLAYQSVRNGENALAVAGGVERGHCSSGGEHPVSPTPECCPPTAAASSAAPPPTASSAARASRSWSSSRWPRPRRTATRSTR